MERTLKWTVEHAMTVRRFGAGPEVVWIHGLGEWSVGFDPVASTPDEFAAWIRSEIPRWGKVIRDAKIEMQ